MGIGGSATNDGGAGLGQALGFRLLDADGREIGPGGGELGRLAGSNVRPGGRPGLRRHRRGLRRDQPALRPAGRLGGLWTAERGHSRDGRPARCATSTTSPDIVARDLDVAIRDLPGSGAAGGLGAGLVAFAGGRLQGGVELVIEAVKLRERLPGADLCLTGEGALDGQSAYGKTAVGVARLAHSLGCPTLAIAGIDRARRGGRPGTGYLRLLQHLPRTHSSPRRWSGRPNWSRTRPPRRCGLFSPVERSLRDSAAGFSVSQESTPLSANSA